MNDETVKMIRAYAKIFFAATVAAQISLVLPMIFIFQIPDAEIHVARFRLAFVGMLFFIVAIVRLTAYVAFRLAVYDGHIKILNSKPTIAIVCTYCPRYELAMLHVRFTRKIAILS